METRIYKVEGKRPEDTKLVEASHPNTAISHVARGIYTASVASPKDVAQLMRSGIEVEVAGKVRQADIEEVLT